MDVVFETNAIIHYSSKMIHNCFPQSSILIADIIYSTRTTRIDVPGSASKKQRTVKVEGQRKQVQVEIP